MKSDLEGFGGALAILALAFTVGLLEWSRPPSREALGQAEGVAGTKGAAVVYEYRVLQDRDLYAEAAAPTKTALEERLGRLGAQGWEPLNPVVRYFSDKGFLVVTGGSLESASFPSREAALLLRRPRTR